MCACPQFLRGLCAWNLYPERSAAERGEGRTKWKTTAPRVHIELQLQRPRISTDNVGLRLDSITSQIGFEVQDHAIGVLSWLQRVPRLNKIIDPDYAAFLRFGLALVFA